MMRRSLRATHQVRSVASVILMLLCAPAFEQSQVSDPEFLTTVAHPAYTQEHPRVVVDEAHHNFHTIEGRYRPFAQLLTSDGYEVVPGTAAFGPATLSDVRVLVIANARGGEAPPDVGKSAFSASECDAIEQWVRNGGSLLLIADHTPFGSAAYDLAVRFGVQMGKGYVFDADHSDNNPTFLVFSTDNGLLGNHPVISGRSAPERVRRVVAFTGQSLSVPSGAAALLKLASSAFEVDSPAPVGALRANGSRESHADVPSGARSDAGRAQGVALVFGKGRVIVTGEAALFSAQLLKFGQPGVPDLRFGMNAPGNDDRQFVLNILHWLSGELH